ncbi:patatin-like phospholipase family protein [Leifsonia naganoensis]|uniref:NTE family protein n=1 Tax=Leifsonia naganoensis TaxID=150025 RepID=A0A853DPI9_9MICO|nr:patatin-like phospholipase family protein [Leifsonia naganoensis]NYK11042.1 NTE family protein [Leifsonia naganoensis]
MNTSPSSALPSSGRRERALVLGGGGSAGNAWEIGVLAGLFDAGLDVTDADLTVGTSAGATVAAQINGATPPELLDAILTAVPPQRPHAAGPGGPPPGGLATGVSVVNHMERTDRIIASSSDAADMRRRMGAAALELEDPDGAGGRWREIVAGRLPDPAWPQRAIAITAIDARTGEGVVFDRDSGIELVDAVAASTSNGFGVPPYRIGDERYLDGGYRRNENADLAAGYARVLVLSPFGGRTRHPLEWGMQLAAQVDELRAGGSEVETVFPDAAALAAFGDNMMDLSTRVPAARAGADQGRALAERLTAFWA